MLLRTSTQCRSFCIFLYKPSRVFKTLVWFKDNVHMWQRPAITHMERKRTKKTFRFICIGILFKRSLHLTNVPPLSRSERSNVLKMWELRQKKILYHMLKAWHWTHLFFSYPFIYPQSVASHFTQLKAFLCQLHITAFYSWPWKTPFKLIIE